MAGLARRSFPHQLTTGVADTMTADWVTPRLEFHVSADSEVLLPPNNSADFESLCLAVWRELWQDHDAQMNGRNGQPQAGVDIYGRDGDEWVGVQCNQKNALLWTELTVHELDFEVQHAHRFKPALTK